MTQELIKWAAFFCLSSASVCCLAAALKFIQDFIYDHRAWNQHDKEAPHE